jgi:hypothetical protein
MRSQVRDLNSATGQAGRRPSLRLSLRLVGLAAVIGFAFSETGFAAKADLNGTSDPTIKILVYNLAQAPRAVLAEAEREAGRILSQAGVRASWFECPAANSDAEGKDACQTGWGSVNLGLRILVKPTSFDNRLQGDALGFAIFPALASVYYDHRLRFVGDDIGLGLPTILGCFIAHEIGHLLLGSTSHSNQGLMQAGWGERQIHQALAGDLLFTSNQVKLIHTEPRTRISRQTRNPTPSLISAE